MKNISLVILLCYATEMFPQNERLSTYSTIGWYNAFSTFRLSAKWGLHGEYQWRRDNLITDWQQSLLRMGVNYQARPSVLLRVGYAWIETFPYGEIPINALGRDFTEHRSFQMVQLTQKEGRFDISHRFMLEQRFVGRYRSVAAEVEDEFPLLHRARYMLRLQAPLKGKTIADKTPYAAVYNEIFVGFGENVNANVFDQNRIGVLVGYRLTSSFRLEAGYLNQIIQFGRRVQDRNVFQYNNGFIVNALFTIDLSRQ